MTDNNKATAFQLDELVPALITCMLVRCRGSLGHLIISPELPPELKSDCRMFDKMQVKVITDINLHRATKTK